jgi:hypothetical protein
MEEYGAERARRVAQFAKWLKAAYDGARGGQRDWFVIISECAGDGAEDRSLRERGRIAAPRAAAVGGAGGRAAGGLVGGFAEFDLPDEGWRAEDSGVRFVQFALCRQWFYMDLPLSTLSKAEAQRILSERPGFRHMADWNKFPKYSEGAARAFNPVDKMYMLGDETAAAEDAAYVFFDVWKFPVDWKFFVTACAFSGGARLAKDAPME